MQNNGGATINKPCTVHIIVEGGQPGGAAFTESIRIHCRKGRIEAGDQFISRVINPPE